MLRDSDLLRRLYLKKKSSLILLIIWCFFFNFDLIRFLGRVSLRKAYKNLTLVRKLNTIRFMLVTSVSCTITRPMEIHQYWTVPRQTQRMITLSFRKEVEAAVQSLKRGKSTGIDNIPAEQVQAVGDDVITSLTTTCNKIWQTREWPTR